PLLLDLARQLLPVSGNHIPAHDLTPSALGKSGDACQSSAPPIKPATAGTTKRTMTTLKRMRASSMALTCWSACELRQCACEPARYAHARPPSAAWPLRACPDHARALPQDGDEQQQRGVRQRRDDAR